MRTFCINYNENLDNEILSNFLFKIISKVKKEIIIVNIGTNKCICDSLGPFIGTLLEKSNIDIPIYGTLTNPIHALNISEQLKIIKNKHCDPFIIAIDAALGENKDCIVLQDKPVCPGKGLDKELPSIGDISILGIVSKNKFGTNTITTRKIKKMSISICNSIINAFEKIKDIRKCV